MTKNTETHSTLTGYQFGTRPGRKIHDVIYCLLSMIRYNISQRGLATYVTVTFCDFSTAFPSIHREQLPSLLCEENIVGWMWKHLRERFHVGKVCVWGLLLLLGSRSSCQALEAQAPVEIEDEEPILTPFTPK